MAALAETFERQLRRLVMLTVEGQGATFGASASAATMAVGEPFRRQHDPGLEQGRSADQHGPLEGFGFRLVERNLATIADVSSAIKGS